MPRAPGVELTTDENSHGVQVLAPDTIVNAAVGVSSTATALPTDAAVVEVATTTETWVKFGTSGVSVSSTDGMFMAAGSAAVWRVPAGATHLAHIYDSAGGRISITRMV